MDSRLYSRLSEHFQHLIPRIDFGATERLSKNEEMRNERLHKQQDRKRLPKIIADITRRSINNADGSIDVKGDVRMTSTTLHSITEIAIFGIVEGDFDCSYNNNLTSLEGSPRKCWDFACSNSQLTTLEGAPIEYRVFYCGGNRVPEDQLLKEHEERIKNMK